jgi:ribosome-interacting GTPase 1
MPLNLPPDALAAERRYRAAQSDEERLETLEEFLSLIPKHKGTDKLRADLRKRLSKLKSSAEGRKGGGKRASAFHIRKEGAGQVVVLGCANVGKSALLAALTNATPEVSASPFTTWQPAPGMMPIENIQVQLVDTPPLDAEYVDPELYNLIRQADLILLMVDLLHNPIQQLEESIARLEEHRIVPQHRSDEHVEGERLTAIPLLVLVNKNDDPSSDEDYEIFCALLEGEWPCLPISVAAGRNLERMRQMVYEGLQIMRVYSKAPGKDADLEKPFVLPKGGTVEQFAQKVHRDFYENLKAARVWGLGVFDGQLVQRDHVLHDGDVVELRI